MTLFRKYTYTVFQMYIIFSNLRSLPLRTLVIVTHCVHFSRDSILLNGCLKAASASGSRSDYSHVRQSVSDSPEGVNIIYLINNVTPGSQSSKTDAVYTRTDVPYETISQLIRHRVASLVSYWKTTQVSYSVFKPPKNQELITVVGSYSPRLVTLFPKRISRKCFRLHKDRNCQSPDDERASTSRKQVYDERSVNLNSLSFVEFNC